MKNCVLRPLLDADVPAAHQLSRSAGWNQTQRDWRRALRYEPDGCFAAERDGAVVGTVTTTRYGTQLAWIGMMLVHPDHRRQGIARGLMQRAIDYLQQHNVECIRLDATPAGRPLYEQLGFQPEWTFHRWHSPGQTSRSATDPIFQASPESTIFTDCDFDRTAFGADRRNWLRAVAADSIVVQQDEAFGMLRTGERASYLGPVTATSDSAATQVLAALLERSDGPVFWDIPPLNEHALLAATAMGFAPVRELVRMRLGSSRIEPNPAMQYAIVDPGMG